jgi:hypothetical protein
MGTMQGLRKQVREAYQQIFAPEVHTNGDTTPCQQIV